MVHLKVVEVFVIVCHSDFWMLFEEIRILFDGLQTWRQLSRGLGSSSWTSACKFWLVRRCQIYTVVHVSDLRVLVSEVKVAAFQC